jgi:hypothetical protein
MHNEYIIELQEYRYLTNRRTHLRNSLVKALSYSGYAYLPARSQTKHLSLYVKFRNNQLTYLRKRGLLEEADVNARDLYHTHI